MSRPLNRKLLAVGFGAAFATPVLACGPFFPNQLLFNGGQSVTWAPVADFRRELGRIERPPSPFRAIAPDERSNVFEQTSAVDLLDLKDSLSKLGTPADRQAKLFEQYAGVRRVLTEHAHSDSDAREKDEKPSPLAANLRIPDGLPGEFALYLRGVISFHRGNMDEARAAWEVLLRLPPEQRRYRTTWAHFMIGKSYLGSDPARAVQAFERVRELAKAGWADSLGLAASSLGWEARAQLDRQNYTRAIQLYLEQSKTGDPTSTQSLAMTCADLFSEHSAQLTALAFDPEAARVIMAYAIARGGPLRPSPEPQAVKMWLEAVEKSGVDKVIGAERLAWAAYQSGDMSLAQRWLAKSPDDAPIALWLRAKLLLRAGNRDSAAQFLARAARAFPRDERWSNVPGTYEPHEVSGADLIPSRRVTAELGVLQLARGEYVDSLDCLLRAGWWLDAAYVAERVLREDELIHYVDANWPEGSNERIRHLLARRLTRIGRWKEARAYFPSKLRPRLDEYVSDIRAGHDSKLAAAKRAEALWSAARIARKEGLELLGTELTPDDFADRGEFPGSALPERRNGSKKDPLLPATADEIHRVARSAPEPQKRWHYRYIAAEHAWSAAQFMPDETDALARLLCEAGGWLKGNDPKAADRFYKALVTRCKTTQLGQQALQMKWFPELKTQMP